MKEHSIKKPIEKPKSITITVADRKENKSSSFVVYNLSLKEVEDKIKKLFGDQMVKKDDKLKNQIKKLRKEVRFLNVLLDMDGVESEWDWNEIFEDVCEVEETGKNRLGQEAESYPKGFKSWLKRRWNL